VHGHMHDSLDYQVPWPSGRADGVRGGADGAGGLTWEQAPSSTRLDNSNKQRGARTGEPENTKGLKRYLMRRADFVNSRPPSACNRTYAMTCASGGGPLRPALNLEAGGVAVQNRPSAGPASIDHLNHSSGIPRLKLSPTTSACASASFVDPQTRPSARATVTSRNGCDHFAQCAMSPDSSRRQSVRVSDRMSAHRPPQP
jgi:hypothetical protein